MISRKGLHLLIGITYLTAFLALSEPTQADTILQQQGTLERGDQVIEQDGSLADLYTFTGEAGQQIRITLESSEFDAYLILLDPDSNQIADNDDANQSTHNAELVVTLPEDGTYSVIVNGYDRSDRGRYELTIDTSAQTAVTAQNSSRVAPQQTILDGFYSVGGTDMALEVEGGQYQYSDEYGSNPWKSVTELEYVRDGVLRWGGAYWCLARLSATRRSECSANGWIEIR